MSVCFRILLTVTVCCTASTTFAQGNELFSKVNPGAAYASAKSDRKTETLQRVTSAEDIRELLKTAGFDAKVAGNRSASATKEVAQWTIPVLVTVSEDERWIHVVLGLKTISDVSKELSAKTLLGLMSASQQHAPASFVYHADRKRTEVSVSLRNDGLTGTNLRDEINRLAIAARKTSNLWASERPVETQVTVKNLALSTTTQESTLTGQWVASKSATEAFALDLQAAGTFKLVHIKDGQQTNSSGKYTVSATSLTLNTDSLNLVGTLKVTSGTQFEFTLANQPALAFSKAK